MRQTIFKTISLLLLLLAITSALAFTLYPKYSEIKITFEEFNTRQVANNATLNIFSQISYPAIAGIAHEQGEPETLEYISEDILQEHRKKHGVVQLEKAEAFLQITSVDIQGKIVDGDDANSMDRGFWHYPLSTIPGKKGNTIIIGHRFLNIPPRKDTFFNLDKVKVGDSIEIVQRDSSYTYTVIHTFVVDKNNISILDQTSDYRVTLITCTPLWSSDQRLIIIGKMDRVYGNI